MTCGDHPRISTLGLAKALHPAGWNRLREAQPDEPAEEGSRPPAPAGPAGEVQTALSREDTCRARLRTATEGWLSLPGRAERLPVVIAAVDGDDVLLVARPTWGLGDPATTVAARLGIGGVTTDLRRWVVRVHGLLQTVVREASPPRAGLPGGRAHPDVGAPEPEEVVVLALTVERVRGFESGGGPTPGPAPV
jgi:hypothetical protein